MCHLSLIMSQPVLCKCSEMNTVYCKVKQEAASSCCLWELLTFIGKRFSKILSKPINVILCLLSYLESIT